MFKRKKIKNSYKSKFQRGNYFTEVQFQNVNRNFSYPCPWFFFHWLRNSYNFFIPPSVPIIAFSSWSFAFFPIFSLPSPTMIVWDKFLGISFKSPCVQHFFFGRCCFFSAMTQLLSLCLLHHYKPTGSPIFGRPSHPPQPTQLENWSRFLDTSFHFYI